MMAKKRAAKRSRSTTVRKAPAKRTRAAAKVVKRARVAPARHQASGRAAARPAAAPDALRALAQRIVDLTLKQDDEGAFALYADDVESIEPRNPPMIGMDAIK